MARAIMSIESVIEEDFLPAVRGMVLRAMDAEIEKSKEAFARALVAISAEIAGNLKISTERLSEKTGVQIHVVVTLTDGKE